MTAAAILGSVTTAGANGGPARPDAGGHGHAKVERPPANGRFDYQIGGDYKPKPSVAIVDRDRTGKPATGVYNICYINAFQTQAENDKWWKKHHDNLLLHKANGHLVEDPGWPGEYLLDTSTSHHRKKLANIEDGWLDGCQHKRFDGVEPDNLDSNTRSHHLLTRANNFDFAKLLIKHAHHDGLAIAQKNDAEHSKEGHSIGFDFAIAEECEVYHECSYYRNAYGNQVYEIEYTDNGRSAYTKACEARGAKISVILRDRNVVPKGSKHYHYQAC
jgi:hypothetical protein